MERYRGYLSPASPVFSLSSYPLRRLPAKQREIYLTFDDGPHPEVTPRLLDLFDELNAKSTFFLVGEHVRRHRTIAERIVARGHAVGNHSGDHAYHHYFRGQRHLRAWVERSQDELTNALGVKLVGFRPPAGVLTPPLVRAVKSLGLPLILWSRRFFDTRFAFTPKRATRAAVSAVPGDIFLLHDRNNADPEALIAGLRVLVKGVDRVRPLH